MKRKKKVLRRTTRDIGKSVEQFLTPLWNVGSTFTLLDVKKFCKKTSVNSERRVLDSLVKQKLLHLNLVVDEAREGRGHNRPFYEYRVRVNNPDRLHAGLKFATGGKIERRRGRTLSKKGKDLINHVNGDKQKTLQQKVRVLETKLAEYADAEQHESKCPRCNFNIKKFNRIYKTLYGRAMFACENDHE